ncbi:MULTISPECIES: phage holin family protein [Cytobacillus]|uniref:Phage holin family protein n=1 Tax=Cytobacillus stercorigallinarum TaxID=2762240 RepID=A0ABR8QNF6_9BACI|nr:phage holin family protein [Cytobacillus stercorigallinarum]MBD7937061.1 phage holin family protein [Cytobacillus stercorigallinarum]
MKWLIGIVINAVLFIALSGFIGDSFYLSGFGSALLASFILSILNIIVRPIFILLTLPITVISLGLFLFVINAVTLMITSGLMGDTFEIAGFGTAILVAIIMSVANLIIQKVLWD